MIRLATTEDVKEISALWEQMVLSMRPEWKPRRDIWEAMCVAMLESGFYSILVAEKDNKIVGFIDGMIAPEPADGKIHGVGRHFFIIPELRGVFGAKLYKDIVNLAVTKGAEVLEFFCFLEELPFWQRHGYEPSRIMVVK